MIHLFHLRVTGEEFHHLLRVLRMAVQTQGQGFHTLQQQEGIIRRDGGAGIAQENGAQVCDESGGTCCIAEGDAVIAGVCLRDRRKFAAGLPVKLARVDDNAAEGRAVSADKLGGGMEHDVRAVLDGPDQIGRAAMASISGMSELGLPRVSR